MELFVVNLLGQLDLVEPDPLELSGFEIFIALSAIQLAWRHPGIGEELREHLHKLGHLLQRQFDSHTVLAVLAETGWDTSVDVMSGMGG